MWLPDSTLLNSMLLLANNEVNEMKWLVTVTTVLRYRFGHKELRDALEKCIGLLLPMFKATL